MKWGTNLPVGWCFRPGVGAEGYDYVILTNNPIDCAAQADNLQALLERGVNVSTNCAE